jgi:hypothetical protein
MNASKFGESIGQALHTLNIFGDISFEFRTGWFLVLF